MKDILQQTMKNLEKAFDNPQSVDLESSIRQLQSAKEQYGDKGTMIEDAITALTQTKNSMVQMENANDSSPADSFGQAHNALAQAIEAYTETDNDPI